MFDHIFDDRYRTSFELLFDIDATRPNESGVDLIRVIGGHDEDTHKRGEKKKAAYRYV